MSQAENSKLSPSSNSLGWYIAQKVVLLVIIFAAYSYFTNIPNGMIKAAITIGILSIASATVMAGKVIDLGLPITCTIGYTVSKLIYASIAGDNPSDYALEASLVAGILCTGLTGYFTGLVITRKYIPSYFGSFAIPAVVLYLLYLIFDSGQQGITGFITMNNMYDISNTTQYAFAGVIGALTLLFSISKYGKNLRATGSSEDGAVEAGINTRNCIISAYTFSGLLAGAAGILLVYIPQEAVQAFYFPVLSWLPITFLGAVIGGNKFSGGKFDVLGAFFGGIIAVVISNLIILFTNSSAQASAIVLLVTLIIVMATTNIKK